MMEEIREEKTIKSAFDSSTFDATVSIHVQKDATDIGSATISPSGRDVAIASKTGLDIIDLDSPLNPPRHLRHNISWNVADVQWSPFAARDYWVASTSNQKALVWNLTMQEESRHGAIEHTLHAHTRAITDINFSAHHPDILATCAVDGYVHAWDLRRPRRPVMTFVDWDAGATQVKWNRQDGHILASSHDRWLRIWDDRHGAYPLRSIEAHASKIYGVDWNRTRASGVVTCSLDKSIKFWDYTAEEDIPERVIRTAFPVWRARHTPFGWGLLAMPQNSPGNLYLYDRRKEGLSSDTEASPVEIFSHGERQVKEFLWRSRGTINGNGIDDREFQLVSWGDDKELKLQRVPNALLENVGYVKGSQVRKRLNVTRKGAIYKTFRNIERTEIDKKSATIKGPRLLSSSHDKDNSYNVLSDEIKKMSPTKRLRARMGGNGSTMRGRVAESEHRSQIHWMSGIKFSTGDGVDEAGHHKVPPRRLSVISPNFDIEGDWDSPESLHDEIIRVHHQYSKVSFDNINMDKRCVTMSMNGPWGQDGESIFIKATVQFPDQYPGAKLPTFSIGQTSLIPNETYQRMTREMRQIIAGFVDRRRGCLEAAICYLLGEVDLEESTLWLKDAEDIDNLDGLADESSSDEDDDDMPASNSAMMSQELDPTTTEGMLAANRRHANVPLPRVSGARFANNGKLVCFFPPKEERFKSLLGSIGRLDKSRTKGEPSFNTFSRLASDGFTPRNKFVSLHEEEDDESDSSQGSGSTSSSDSDSSQFQVSVAFDFWRKIQSTSHRKGLSTNRSNKSSGAGTGTGTGTGTGISKGRLPKPKNTIVLHDIRHLIPGKLELAQEYAVFGEGADVCNHNAMIAQKYGYQERADIWTYAGMLLQHEVPLEILDQSHRKEPILVIARNMITRCRRDSQYDSGVDMPYDCKDSAISGRVKWGFSPLAKYLIHDLFEHFQKLADIQMLAMLSCVFSESSAIEPLSITEIRLTQPQTPLSMKTPAFSLDYFPSDVAAWSAYQKTPYSSIPSTPRTALTPVAVYGSVGSSNGPWGSDPASASFSCGETPPQRSTGGSAEKLNERLRLQSQSLSTSPEDSRGFRRANSGLAASFAANLKNPFYVTASSSPPSRKRPSPVESMISTLTPSAVTWGNTTYLETVREKSPYAKSSYSDDDNTTVDEALRPVIGISVTMHNQNAFDDEGCVTTSLLDFSHGATFSSYRKLYAEMLFAWSLPYTRLEILKFDSMPDHFTSAPLPSPILPKSHSASIHSMDHETSPSPMLLGKKSSHPALPDDRGLSITGYCLKHESRLEALPPTSPSPRLGGAVGRCERCKMTKSQLRCVICIEPLTGEYAACLSCGCASHQICLDAYFSSWEEDEVDELTCPGGCDCECVRQAGSGVVESWEVMMGALEKMRRREARRVREREERQRAPRRGVEEWEEEGSEWEGARSGTEASLKGGVAGARESYSTLSRRLGQVRAGEGWMGVGSGLRKKGSVIRGE